MKPQLHNSWLSHLQDELNKGYMQELKLFLQAEKNTQKVIYPPGRLMFHALNSTPLCDVKVVILGQDPYHGPDQAHGLAFSVPDGVKVPPSLVNIFKEIKADCGIENLHGDLSSWAQQGVLLLNSVLSVVQAQAGSHQNCGWERFTDKIIEVINQQCHSVVFMLWGAYAQKKGMYIDDTRHLILKAPHPSPLSAYRGFFGCKHFSKCNHYLKLNDIAAINWNV